MLYSYKYDPVHEYYMKEQIWECKSDITIYAKLSEYEYESYKDYIGKPHTVLDLGCGIGRVSIYLNQILNDATVHYILLDTTGNTFNLGRWDMDEYYNDLSVTKSFAELNGLINFEIFESLSGDWGQLKDIDLVISCCSFGMHVPIERYMDKLLAATTPNCTMIFGTRNRGLYSENSFNALFDTVTFLRRELQEPFPQEDWLILQNKK